MASPKQARVDWSGLPSAVVDLVSRRITTNADYVRFRVVCTSWRSATPARPRHLPRQLPWLALPSPGASDVRRFFSLPDGKIHIIETPGSRGSHCCGSSFGWLVFLDTPINFLLHYVDHGLGEVPSFFAGVLRRSRADDLLGLTLHAARRSKQWGCTSDLDTPVGFFLLNPLTRERIPLPPLNTREVLQNLALEPGGGYVVRGRPGPDFSCDLEYIRRHLVSRGRLYAVDTRLALYVCVVGPPARIQEFPFSGGFVSAAGPTGERLVRGRRRRAEVIERAYLVESCGDLLMVLKTYDDAFATPGGGDEEDEDHPMPDFEVYKLDLIGEAEPPRWAELESLGDQVLFLGPGHSFSLPAGDFMDGCPGNCIYFNDYRPGRQAAAVHGGPDFGIFHLGDGHVERVPCCPVDPGSVWQPSLWISPSLRSATSSWE